MPTGTLVRSNEPAIDETHAGRVRLNLEWLIRLRWAAVLGQLLTVATVQLFLDIDLPVTPLAVIIALTGFSNLAFGLWFRRQLRDGSWDQWSSRGAWLEGSVMVADVLLLTALLYVAGGPANPFAVFYLVHVILAAVLLRARWAWSLNVLSVACYGLLYLGHDELPALASASLRTEGLLVAVAVAATISVYFVVRVTSELERRERDLDFARQRRARTERVESLVTLAAGAAHELSTPLSTIAVVAKELERALEAQRSHGAASSESIDDARLIRKEVTRCRSILDQMAASSGGTAGESMRWTAVGDLVEQIVAPLRAGARVSVLCEGGAAEHTVLVPRRALKRALRGLIKNGLDASDPDGHVQVTVTLDEATVRFVIEDEGHGMDDAVAARAWEPFYTTKDPGAGMGLGLYLAVSVVERLGGRLAIASVVGQGTRITVTIPAEPTSGDAASAPSPSVAQPIPGGAA